MERRSDAATPRHNVNVGMKSRSPRARAFLMESSECRAHELVSRCRLICETELVVVLVTPREPHNHSSCPSLLRLSLNCQAWSRGKGLSPNSPPCRSSDTVPENTTEGFPARVHAPLDIDVTSRLRCAVKRRWSTARRKTRPGTGSLHPVAIGAAVEVTKPPEPPM
jgi:hypothetical protein